MNKKIIIKYSQSSAADFQKDLKAQVKDYLDKNGGTKNAPSSMWFRLLFFFALYWFSWAQLALTTHSSIISILFILGLIFAFKGIAYNAVHDGCHNAITGNKKVDQFIYWLSLSMLGPDPYLWDRRHNVDHHHYVNIPGLDSQIEGAKVFRFSPHQEWKPYHQFQHLYASVIYSIVTLHWIFIRDFVDVLSPEFRKDHTDREFKFHLGRMVLNKALYLFLMVGVPAYFLPYNLGTIVLTFVSFHLALSLLVTVTFAISHVNEELCFVNPDSNNQIGHSYIEHQLMTSMDYHATNPVVNFVFGGMSAHVAHHMFPTVSSAHLPGITKIIMRAAKEHGLIYHTRSLPRLVASHYAFLRMMGESKENGFEYFHRPATIYA